MRSTRSVPAAIANDGSVRRLARRNLAGVIGLGLLALCAAIAASLATWTVDDPSLSHATDLAARNVLGMPGAIVSDLLMQFLGVAATLFLVPPVIWAWRLLFALPTRFGRLAFFSWVAGTLAAAAALAHMPMPSTWPLPTGLGGVAGDLLSRLAPMAFGELPSIGRLALVVVLVLAATLFSFLACGIGFTGSAAERTSAPARASVKASRKAVIVEEDDEDAEEDDADSEAEEDDRPGRFSLFVGGMTHLGFSLAAGVSRLVSGGRVVSRGIARRLEDSPPFNPDSRIEPRLSGAAEPPDDDDDEDSDVGGDVVELEPAAAPPKKAPKVTAPAPKPKASKRATREAQPSLLDSEEFELPPLDLLAEPSKQKTTINPQALEQNARLLEGVLDDFGVKGEIVNVRPGPVVTLYELEPAPGIKSARVIGLADDIARSMSAIACRVAVIPGKNAIGIELPNARRETVFLRELLASEDFEKSKSRLGLCLGKTIGGEPVIADLARMPHLLVAGTTGSGKSVSINTMILSLLYKWTPAECRMIMIDPKMLELSIYDGIPHLLTPVVTDPKQAVVALKWTVREMEDRYRKMSKLGVRNIDGFNARLEQAKAKGESIARTVQTGFDPHTGEAIYEQEELSLEPLPFIVVIIDEMADLMMVAGKDIEGAVQRLAQMARAAGIHIITATQRPSVDVITGTIKANFPTRISFQVTSKIDSRTILGEMGAEQLLGQGDMLYMAGGGRIQRVHGPFVSDHEVEEIVAHLKSQGTPAYLEAITADDEDGDGEDGFDPMAGGEESNDNYDKAVSIVLRDRKASTSYIQRRLGIGYNRAASIIERMEKEGVVGPANHAGKREILVPERDEGNFG
jgi:S-DNA-T family DNA segregation ATPase FtsK/SpoIIIE